MLVFVILYYFSEGIASDFTKKAASSAGAASFPNILQVSQIHHDSLWEVPIFFTENINSSNVGSIFFDRDF